MLKDGARTSAEEIVRFVEERVADHKRLRGGVVFVDRIPRSVLGKIVRREVVETAKGVMKRVDKQH